MRLGIDLDGVVADFTGGWIRYYNDHFGTSLTTDLVTSWDAIPQLTHFTDMGEFWSWSSDLDGSSIFRHLDPFPGAIDAVRRLAREHSIVVITTKPTFAHADTADWLAEHRFPFDELHLTEDKQFVEADAYLDDGPHVLDALVAHRPSALVCRYIRPWNQPVPGTIDVSDWPEFERVVLANSDGPSR